MSFGHQRVLQLTLDLLSMCLDSVVVMSFAWNGAKTHLFHLDKSAPDKYMELLVFTRNALIDVGKIGITFSTEKMSELAELPVQKIASAIQKWLKQLDPADWVIAVGSGLPASTATHDEVYLVTVAQVAARLHGDSWWAGEMPPTLFAMFPAADPRTVPRDLMAAAGVVSFKDLLKLRGQAQWLQTVIAKGSDLSSHGDNGAELYFRVAKTSAPEAWAKLSVPVDPLPSAGGGLDPDFEKFLADVIAQDCPRDMMADEHGELKRELRAAARWTRAALVFGGGVDVVIANAPAKHMIVSFELRRDLGVKGGLGLQFELELNVLRPTRQRLRMPLPYPAAAAPKISEDDEFELHLGAARLATSVVGSLNFVFFRELEAGINSRTDNVASVFGRWCAPRCGDNCGFLLKPHLGTCRAHLHCGTGSNICLSCGRLLWVDGDLLTCDFYRGIASCLPEWGMEADHAADIGPGQLWEAEADQARPITDLSPLCAASVGAGFLDVTKRREGTSAHERKTEFSAMAMASGRELMTNLAEILPDNRLIQCRSSRGARRLGPLAKQICMMSRQWMRAVRRFVIEGDEQLSERQDVRGQGGVGAVRISFACQGWVAGRQVYLTDVAYCAGLASAIQRGEGAKPDARQSRWQAIEGGARDKGSCLRELQRSRPWGKLRGAPGANGLMRTCRPRIAMLMMTLRPFATTSAKRVLARAMDLAMAVVQRLSVIMRDHLKADEWGCRQHELACHFSKQERSHGGAEISPQSATWMGLSIDVTLATGLLPCLPSEGPDGVALERAARSAGLDLFLCMLVSPFVSEVAPTVEPAAAVNLEYLSTALRVRREDGREPFFSLDPVVGADTAAMQSKRFEPAWLIDTCLGEVMFQADYRLKELSMGEHMQPVVGMKSCSDFFDGREKHTDWNAREWFVVRKASVLVSGDNALIPYISMGVEAREQVMSDSGMVDAQVTRPDHPLARYAEVFTQKFDLIAERLSVVNQLREVAKASVLAKYLLDSGAHLDESWFNLASAFEGSRVTQVPQLWNERYHAKVQVKDGTIDEEALRPHMLGVYGGVQFGLEKFTVGARAASASVQFARVGARGPMPRVSAALSMATSFTVGARAASASVQFARVGARGPMPRVSAALSMATSVTGGLRTPAMRAAVSMRAGGVPRGVDLNLDGFEFSETERVSDIVLSDAGSATPMGSSFWQMIDDHDPEESLFADKDVELLRAVFHPRLSDRRAEGDLFVPPPTCGAHAARLRALVREEAAVQDQRRRHFFSAKFDERSVGALFPFSWQDPFRAQAAPPRLRLRADLLEQAGELAGALGAAVATFDKLTEEGSRFRAYRAGDLELRTCQEAGGPETVGAVLAPSA
ncbi:unnamed protein product [Prorocentrum cordatum]|uniref:Uncharacterized protein n=1 Tax=Prorocentrum cordatum TaxID=2364126 RepID=A0ABN9TPD2_9DINO|nr:unnamed protein product [Polarella glacialis]